MSFFEELKRRNVIRVGVAYLIASWLLLQIVDVLVSLLELPGWVGRLVFMFIVIGLVPVLIFSWVYEMTPEGLRRESEVMPDASTAAVTAKRLDRITIFLVLIVGGIVIVDRLLPESATPPAVAPVASTPESNQPDEESMTITDTRQSVAVIPFVNMSDDDANEYFSDGISEELLNALVGIDSLRIPSRTSSFTFKGSDKKLDEIGRDLNVAHVLEGSVRKAGNQIRVTAQLIEVSTDTHLWSETYTRELDDIFAVQDEIAQAIVVALRVELSGSDRQKLETHPTDNVEAYDNYLTGRYLWNVRTVESMEQAIEYFETAIEQDPDFDQAWAALADVYTVLPSYTIRNADEYVALAREAANRALEINPDSAQALAALGSIKSQYEYDWEGAEADFQRSIEINANYASGRQQYAETLVILGRLDEALVQMRIARELDPLSVTIRHVPGYFHMWNFNFEEAEKHYQDELELGRPIRWLYQNMDVLTTLTGRYDEAREYATKLAEMEAFDPAADLARIDAVENPELKERAIELLEQRTDIGDGVFGKGLQYALLGEYESALDSIERGFADGDPYSAYINFMKVYDPLRDNPRFQTMLRKMNLLR